MDRKSSKTLRHKAAVSEYLKFQTIQKKHETLEKITSSSTKRIPRPGEFLVCSTDLTGVKNMTLSEFNQTGLLRPSTASFLRPSLLMKPSPSGILTTQLRSITRSQISEMLTLSSVVMGADDNSEKIVRPRTGIPKKIEESRPNTREQSIGNKPSGVKFLRPASSYARPEKNRKVIKKDFNVKKEKEGDAFSITTPIETFIQEAREELGRTENTKFLPLEMYNPHHDVVSPQKFIKSIKDKHGEAIAFSKWFYPDGTYEWKKCVIIDYDNSIERYSIQWENGSKKYASRINIRLLEESEELFDQRLCTAGEFRDHAEVIMKYIFSIKSMKDPTTPLPLKIIDCIINRIFSTKKLTPKEIRVQLLFSQLQPDQQHDSKRMLWSGEITHMVCEQPLYVCLGFSTLQEFKKDYFKNFKDIEMNCMGTTGFVTNSMIEKLVNEVEENFEFAQHTIEFEADMPYNPEKISIFSQILPSEKFVPLGERQVQIPEKTVNYLGFYSNLYFISENLHQSNASFFSILYKQNIQLLEFRRFQLFLQYFPQAYALGKFVRLEKLESLDTLREFRNICFDTQYSIQDILNFANEARQKRNDDKVKAKVYANQAISLEAKLPIVFIEKMSKFMKLCNHTLEREMRICIEKSMEKLISQLEKAKRTLEKLGDFFEIISHFAWKKKNKENICIKCYLAFDNGKAKIQPGFEEIKSGFEDFLQDILYEVKKTSSLGLAEIGNSRESGFMKIVEDPDEKLNNYIKACVKLLKQLWKYPKNSLSYLDCIEYMLQFSIESMRVEVKKNYSIEHIEDEIERLNEAKAMIDQLFSSKPTISFGFIVIKTKSAYAEVLEKYTQVFSFFQETLAAKAEEEIGLIEVQEDEIMKIIQHQPQNLEELDEIKKFLAVHLKERLEYLDTHSSSCLDCINTMENNKMYASKELLFRIWTSFGISSRVDKARHSSLVTIKKREKEFAEQLKSGLAQIIIDIENISNEFEELQKIGDYSKYEEISMSYGLLKDNLEKTSDMCKILNVREGIVGVPSTDFKHLDKLKKEFMNYCKLWFYIRDFSYNEPKWIRGDLASIDSDAVSAEVDMYLNELKVMLNSTFKADINALTLALTLQKSIIKFYPYVPLLKNLKAVGMKDRHWESISKLIGVPITKSLNVSLKNLLDHNAMDFEEEIEEITEGASREQSLEYAKARMEKEWETIAFKIEPYKNSGTYVLVETSEIWEKLDEHLMKVVSMCNSPHANFIEKEINQWKSSLFKLQEILDEWEKLQKSWSYIYPIFTSEDIVNDLPVVAGRFSHVNTQWMALMNTVKTNPIVIEVCWSTPKLQEMIRYSRDTLDTILSSLYEYLNTKRKAFPRFYFLSNEELLSILSNSREVETVQKFINKCFEGINKIVFGGELIIGMESPEQEFVKFIAPILIKDGEHLKSVEVWMQSVESSMQSTLQALLETCFQSFPGSADLSWIESWPSQLVQTALQVNWTNSTESFISGQRNLTSFSDSISVQLSELVSQVRKNISNSLLSTISTLIILTIHNKDTISHLQTNRVRSINDFYWQGELRYYLTSTKVDVRMVDTVKEYGYEYLGNQGRLVITSLTDRCQRILMTAIKLCLGGAPEGPAGTGKTETTKDLAKALGKKCVVFNCSDSLDHLAMGKFFIGLCSCGAWACFDEFNRMEQEVLSVVAEQITVIQAAMMKKAKKFLFDNELVPLDDSCAIFITMNPGYAGRSELPDNLKGLFRPISMMIPDYAMIAEILFYSYGFQNSRILARKLITSFKLASEQLSSQKHYDYGMRAVTAVIKKAGILNRTWKNPNEETLLLQAIKTTTLPKFLPDDLPLLSSILLDLFPDTENYEGPKKIFEFIQFAISDLKLVESQSFIEKIVELYELLQVRHGNMLVGAAMTGKSTALSILAKALYLKKCAENPYVARKYQEVVRVWVNPKSMTLEQLYGEPNESTNDWKDGVLSYHIRMCAEADEKIPHWVELDGPVDALWIENLNTVLDDNKKLCLNSGEIIKLSSNIKLLFEVEDLEQASPATVSRCGMIYLHPNTLGWKIIKDAWLMDLPAGYASSEIVLFISTLFDYFADPCLDFFKSAQCSVEFNPTWAIKNVINLLEAQLLKSSLNKTEHNEMVSEVKNKIIHDKRTSFKKESLGFRGMVKKHFTRKATRKFTKKQTIISEFVMEENNFGRSEKVEIFCMFLFALSWGLGGFLEESGKKKFNEVLHKVYNNSLGKGTGAVALAISKGLGPVFHNDTYFTHFYNTDLHHWESWNSLLLKLPKEKAADLNFILVPCAEIVSKMFILTKLVLKGYNALITGPSGTGKSCSVNRLVTDLDPQRFSNISSTLSAQSSCNMVQEVIEGKLTKRSKYSYGGELGKKCLIVIDDLNMPSKEVYGAQPAIEILRSAIDKGLWYDLNTLENKSLEDLIYLGVMAHTGGRNSISTRYMRHLFLITASEYSSDSLETIYRSFLTQALDKHSQRVQDTIMQITCASIELYQTVLRALPPTPTKSHYTFNLRDITRIFQGVAMVNPMKLDNTMKMYKLWTHECIRVFSDRMIGNDGEVFLNVLHKVVDKWIHINLDEVFTKTSEFLYCNFIGDKGYQECPDMQTARQALENAMDEYNTLSSPKLDLVFFDFAILHLARICRITSTANGHLLLISIGGSGRVSLCKMAAFLQDYSLFQIQVSNTYSLPEWKEDIKSLLFKTGAQNSKQLFLLKDYEIVEDIYFENINNILNSAEVPNLFNQEEKESIIEKIREIRGMSIKSANEKWEIFLQNTKRNLHVVLCISPVGENLKKRLRQFPSFTNCCSIDWMGDWPEEGLRGVTEKYLKETGIAHDMIKQKDIEDVCVSFHYSVLNNLQGYKNETRCTNNITSIHYLQFLKYIRKLLDFKKGQLIEIRGKYKNGVKKIDSTQVNVDIIRQNLTSLKPILEERTKETASIMTVIMSKNVDADVTRTIVSQEQKESAVQAEIAAKIKQECEIKLNKAIPELEAANRALKTLKKDEINEVRIMQKPPYGVQLAVEAVVIINKEKPIKVVNPEDKSKMVLDYFEAGKKMMKGAHFIKKLQKFDKNSLTQETIDKLLPYIENPKFEPEMVRKASVAAEGLCKWVRAMVNFYYINKDVKPKQESLNLAKETMAIKLKLLQDKEHELRIVEENIFELKTQYEKNHQEQMMLVADIDKCEVKMGRAVKLIEKLKGEKERWARIIVKMKQDMKNLLGDIILAAGMMSYMGNFIGGYREKIVQGFWIPTILSSRTITCSTEFLLKNVLSSVIQVQNWHLQNLPTDKASVENAIILTHSFKWPLFIDPQSQAFKWISKMQQQEKTQLVVIKPGFEEFYAVIENAMFLGNSLWIENVGESLNPVLTPLLNKAFVTEAGVKMVKLGETYKQIDGKFKLYMSTTVPNPNFAPETTCKIGVINFSITPEGLAEQLLALVCKKMLPKETEEKNKLAVNSFSFTKRMQDFEDRILIMLQNSGDDILDNEVLINSLTESKTMSEDTERKLQSAIVAEQKINELQAGFVPVATASSLLYFAVSDMRNIDSMYVFSIEWFLIIFTRGINKASVSKIFSQQVENLTQAFREELFTAISMCLFDKDKLLFSFLIAVRLVSDWNLLQWRHFLTGLAGDVKVQENPVPEVIQENLWTGVANLASLSEFSELSNHLISHKAEWTKYLNTSDEFQEDTDFTSFCEKIPNFFQDFSMLEKLLIIKTFKPENLVKAIQAFVRTVLGKQYLQSPGFSMKQVYAESDPNMPMIFILTPGKEPESIIKSFAYDMGTNIYSIALGKGQGEKASKVLKEFANTGGWVLLQNCHLLPSWMPELENIIQRFRSDSEKGLLRMHNSFRICLTTKSTPIFPITILQHAVKVVNESAQGLKNNLKALFQQLSSTKEGLELFEKSARQETWQKLLFGLCFFHCQVIARQKFGALGWNVKYEFTASDLKISQRQLKILIEKYPNPPYEALKYLTGECNYGGRVTDNFDRITLNSLLSDIYCDDIMYPHYRFGPLQAYQVPSCPGSIGDFISMIESFPSDESPLVFGLNQNANIAHSRQEASELLESLVKIEANSSVAAPLDKHGLFLILDEILRFLLPEFSIGLVKAKYPLEYENSLNTFLLQEVEKFNTLLRVIKTSIAKLKKALDGLIVISNELENLYECIAKNQVPDIWSKYSYNSSKPLMSWVKDLHMRLVFFNGWVNNTYPDVYLFSAFFFPQSFLTSLLQNFARGNRVAIDNLQFVIEVVGNEKDSKKEGCMISGLFIEGARWDCKKNELEEAADGKLYENMPNIWLRPSEKNESPRKQKVYSCPVYRTAKRVGVLSTTGHSTNYVMSLPLNTSRDAKHWIQRGVAILTQLND